MLSESIIHVMKLQLVYKTIPTHFLPGRLKSLAGYFKNLRGKIEPFFA